MSMNKKPLTDLERNGLRAHGLPRAEPSQLSDAFRNGMAWIQAELDAALEREQALAAQLQDQDAPLRSIPRLKQQLASYRDEYEQKLRQCIDLMHQRDESAARGDRLREALHQALVHWGAHCTDEDGTAYAECQHRCDESPATSLARRDLIKQAEALEMVSSDVKSMHPKSSPVGIGVHIGIEAKKLRQRAQALN